MNKETLIDQLKEQHEILDIIDTTLWSCDFISETWKESKKKLLEIHRQTYLPNQYIIIVFDRTKFNNFLSFSNFVQKWQQIINEVDISNCFVMILHNEKESTQILEKHCKEISIDPSSMKFLTYDSMSNHSSDKKSTFCISPWIHLMIQPFNQIHPCCVSNESLGNAEKNTLKEAWNSETMRRMRLSMINGSYHPACSKCYENELHSNQSMRKRINAEFSKHFDLVKSTNFDGSLDDFNLRYFDIRFSNICNLRCRTCNHHASSRWYSDQKKLDSSYDNPVIIKAGRYETDIWEQIEPHISLVEQVYFAGGEPLLMDEHYWILDALEKQNKLDIKLFYNTNFTIVNKIKRHIFDYWKNFTDVTVAASLDAMGSRAEYLRKDTNWQEIVNNRMLLKQMVPHVKFKIAVAVSIINVLHLPDFHREWIQKGLVAPDDIMINLVSEPDYYKIDIAPEIFKEKIRKKYKDHAKWLLDMGASEVTCNAFLKCISFLDYRDNSLKLNQLKQRTRELDILRKENILEVFPELDIIFQNDYQI
jgi:organic radical activating enzyme